MSSLNTNVHRFLNAEETEKPEQVKFNGTIPEWLQGDYVRVGPGLWDLEEHTMYHFLDGYAILTKFNFSEDNKITLTKKFLQSDAYKKALDAKKPLMNEYGTRGFPDPNKGFFSRMTSAILPEASDNVYSTPYQIGSNLLLAADTPFFRSIDQCTLDSKDKFDSNKCFGCVAQSAHPLQDENGDLWQVGTSTSALAAVKYNVIKISKCDSGSDVQSALRQAKTICTVPSSWSGVVPTIHSFGMSSNYIIVIEQPHVVPIKKVLTSVLQGNTTDTIKDWMEWRNHEANSFHIIEKSTGKFIKTEIFSENSFYFMHVINCFEEDDHLIIDVISYDSPSVLETLVISKLRAHKHEDSDHPYTQRFTIPLANVNEFSSLPEESNLISLKSSECKAIRKGQQIILSPEIITDIKGADVPSMNRKYLGKKYEYYYAAGTYNPSPYSHQLCKVNVQTKEIVEWKLNDGFPGEPLFVRNPTGSSEDDGILISAVTNFTPGVNDFLVLLDAKTMTEIGRAIFKNKIPPALHGIFIPTL